MPSPWIPVIPLALLALVPLASVELAKGLRWQMLLGTQPPRYVQCLAALLAGQITNALSPVRAGDVVQVGWLAAVGNPLASGLAAVVAAKVLDALVLAAIALLLLGTSALPHSSMEVLLLAAMLLAGLCVAYRPGRVRGWLAAVPLSRKLRLEAVLDVAGQLRSPRVLLAVLITSAVVWAGGLAANALILEATGTSPTLDLAARMLVAGYVAGVLPAPPASLGVFEATVTLALTSAGVPVPAALAAAITLHVCQLTELGILLAFSLFVRRWSWSA